MWKIHHSRSFRRLFLACCLMLSVLLLAGCGIPEGGFSWRLWGFEDHFFTVDGEEIDMRLDTSGFGRYEVELLEEDGTIRVIRDGSAILEGWFTSAGECTGWMAAALDGQECEVIEYSPEDSPASMLYRYGTAEEAGCILLLLIDGSALGVVFHVLDCGTDETALNCAHRLQFTRKS